MTSIDLQPTLTGYLVTLRPVQKDDWDGMFAAASDPKVWAGHVKRDRYKEDVFRSYFESGLSSRSAFSIIDNETSKIIGTSRYHNHIPKTGEIEIGWTFLECDYWGGTYNKEVKKLMLKHIFKFVDVVVFWIAKENLRSQGAVKKIGCVLRQGEQSKTDQGIVYPYVVYELRKPCFKASSLWN